MADDFFLDEAAHEGIRTDPQSIGKKFGDDYNKLVDVLLGRDGAWGAEAIGKAFAKKYIGENSAPMEIAALGGVAGNPNDSVQKRTENTRKFAGLDRESAGKLYLL